MIIGIANDHAGYKLKNNILIFLEKELNFKNVIDFGSDTDDSVDYPDYAKKVINAIEQNNINMGILICGTGIGMSICANRNKHIRAALCLNTEYAKLAREHNDANVLVLGARYISFEKAKNIVNTFLDSKFQNGRHLSRINKINLSH